MHRRTLHAILPLACMVATAVAFAATPGDPATTHAPAATTMHVTAGQMRKFGHLFMNNLSAEADKVKHSTVSANTTSLNGTHGTGFV